MLGGDPEVGGFGVASSTHASAGGGGVGGRPSSAGRGDVCCRSCRESCLWNWRVRWMTKMCRVGAVVCGVLSLLVLWCEVTIPVNDANLSIFGLLVKASQGSHIAVLFTGGIPLWYMSLCTFHALFSIKALQPLQMFPGRQTNAYNLLFNSSYNCRLWFTMCFNFLVVLGKPFYQDKASLLDGKVHSVAFQTAFGDMDLVPFLGDSFNIFTPIAIAVVALITALKLHVRFLRCIGVDWCV